MTRRTKYPGERKVRTLAFGALLAGCCALESLSLPIGLQIALGTILVFCGPGLLSASRGRRRPKTRWFEYGAVSVVVGITVVVLLGLLLDLTPSGLTRTSEAIGLAAATLIATGAMALADRAAEPQAEQLTREVRTPPINAVAAVLLTIAIGFAAVGLGVHSAQRASLAQPVTDLWIVPVGAMGVQVGVDSTASRSQAYQLVITIDSTVEKISVTVSTGSSWRRIFPDPGRTEFSATLLAPDGAGPALREAHLAAGAA